MILIDSILQLAIYTGLRHLSCRAAIDDVMTPSGANAELLYHMKSGRATLLCGMDGTLVAEYPSSVFLGTGRD